MPLRGYQEADIARIRAAYADGARAALYQAPTGSGKTVLFSAVVAGAAERGNRVFILGHRQEIVEQIGDALDELGVAYGIIAAGYPETPLMPVQIASVATLARRLTRLEPPPDLLVIDEVHHAAARTWRRIIDALPAAKILGTTATPQRLDGKGLDDIFDELVVGPAIADLIEQGFLSRFATFAPARPVDLSYIRTRAGDYAIDELAACRSASSSTARSTNIAGAARACRRSRSALISSTANWWPRPSVPAAIVQRTSTARPRPSSAAA
jgi:DNA repair protein RadD